MSSYFHLVTSSSWQVIALTLINEYTDWSVPSEHPINILDSLIDIIGDALVVAPITNTANLHFKKAHQQQLPRNGAATSGGVSIKPQFPRMYSYVFVYQVGWMMKMLFELCNHMLN